jgi:AcrR family transcriptional regulator
MTKSSQALETRIVATALKMFNEIGIEYVGMRELATALGIRIGNLTYYFPTKDDLVYRLSLQLSEENSRTIVANEAMNLSLFFGMLAEVFRNHVRYRCLMLSFVHIMQRNPHIAKRYSKTLTERIDTWERNVQSLIAQGYLKADKQEVAFLVSSLSLISRFWISEAAVSFRNDTGEVQMKHYLMMIGRIFVPYATPKGKKFLNEYLASGE